MDVFVEGDMLEAKAKVICLVTMHGVGFQQPPIRAHGSDPGREGYADHLHRHLRAQASVGPLLSNDPKRGRDGHGPIYVQSHAPTDPTSDASGPDRLGAWSASTGRTINTEGV